MRLYFKVVFDFNLAAQAIAGFDLLAVEETYLGRENGSATFKHLYLTLPAVGLAAACGRQEDFLACQSVHYVPALRHVQDFLAVIDVYFHRAFWRQLRFNEEEQDYQNQRHQRDSED